MRCNVTADQQAAACRLHGTRQCAVICLSHSSSIPLGECPERASVWTDKRLEAERTRKTPRTRIGSAA